MNSIKELMTLHGYHFVGLCHCTGMKTMKYKKGLYQFRWRVNKGQFRLTHDSVVIKSWTHVKEAENYLNTLHQIKEVVV